jgi:hypothetical protein
MDTYSASSIKVLTQDEAINRFEFAYVIFLMEQYPMRSRSNIENGIEACRRIGIDPKYYEDRYLKGLDIPRIVEVEAVFKEILEEQRR